MDRRDAEKKAEKPERAGRIGGGTAEGTGAARQAIPASGEKAGDEARERMEEVLRHENLMTAYKRVVRNGGAGGIDGRNVEDLKDQIREDWPRIRDQLAGGTYEPSPVRKVEIPKPGGGVRVLGIPTVLDRMIQQALLQVLTPVFDPTFSTDSYGFRPGRSTHQAVLRAKEHVEAGYRWVVDLDLAKFFDTVQHDVLMRRVARRVKDKRVLRLIGRYLRAGMMEGGMVSPRAEGTPQGGPLSPLLSNILLDELDKELERRGTPLRAVRGRLPGVREVEGGGRAGHDIAGAPPGGATPPEGEPGEERGGPALETEVPGVPDHDEQEAEAETGAGIGETVESEAEGALAARTRMEPRPHRAGAQPGATGLGQLLRVVGGGRSVRGTGPVDPTEDCASC